MEYEEEIVTLPPKRDRLIHLLKERQEYAIHPTLFKLWMIPTDNHVIFTEPVCN